MVSALSCDLNKPKQAHNKKTPKTISGNVKKSDWFLFKIKKPQIPIVANKIVNRGIEIGSSKLGTTTHDASIIPKQNIKMCACILDIYLKLKDFLGLQN